MADNANLLAHIETLNAKVEALLASQQPAPAPAPVDDQPLIDAADAAVQAILAKIP